MERYRMQSHSPLIFGDTGFKTEGYHLEPKVFQLPCDLLIFFFHNSAHC